MKKLLIAAMLMFTGYGAVAQDALIPMDYADANTQELYQYEQNVINCTEWLVNTPLGERDMDRQVIGQFVLIWMQASPSVVFNFDTKLMEFIENSSYQDEQATVYVGSYMTALLKEKEAAGTLNKSTLLPKGVSKADKITGAIGAIEGSLEFYDKNYATLGRNRDLEKFRKMKKEGKLREYVEANLGMEEPMQ